MKRSVVVVLALAAVSSSMMAQSGPVHEDKAVSIYPEMLRQINANISKAGYRLDSASIVEHLEDGGYTSVSGHFVLTCPDKSSRSADMVFTDHPAKDTLTERLTAAKYEPLLVDNVLSRIESNYSLQFDAFSTLMRAGQEVCQRPMEKADPAFYAAVSLWKSSDSLTKALTKVYQRVSAEVFAGLK